ncbi:MAG: hypothetical protein D6815_01715, partial [Candidatus Dadabacteria bacterium]
MHGGALRRFPAERSEASVARSLGTRRGYKGKSDRRPLDELARRPVKLAMAARGVRPSGAPPRAAGREALRQMPPRWR